MTTLTLEPPMTVRVAEIAPERLPAGWIGPPRLLAGINDADLSVLGAHRSVHGPQPALSLAGLLSSLDAVGLTGRGGAGFPLATKIRSLRAGPRPVVVVNAAEGEPGSAKDSLLLARVPHLVFDGAVVVADAIGAVRIVVATADERLAPRLQRALTGRPDADRFELRTVIDRFIVGEARTLLRVLDGGPALPPGRRVLPTDRGLGGAPTLLSNAETFAQVAVLTRIGPAGFATVGAASEQPAGGAGSTAQAGTTLLTVTGAVARPGVLEVAFGTTLGKVAAAVGAAPAQAVVIGGYHGTWVRPDPTVRLERITLAAHGATLGAGVLMFVGEQTCGLGELAGAARWLADQSARQCGPCAFGLPAMAAGLAELAAGRGDPVALNRQAAHVIGRGACAHPDGAVRFIASAGPVLAAELAQHRHGGCGRPVLGHLPLSRAAAFAARAVRARVAS